MRAPLFQAACLLVAVVLASSVARGEDPLIAAREFCIADGRGDRLSPYEWQRIAPMVTWELEPAWDRVVLIRGYEISTPRRSDGQVEVEVVYTIVDEVTPGDGAQGEAQKDGSESEQRRETVTLTLVANGSGWLVGGAPHPPHVFENVVDAEALTELMQPQTDYASNSAFVWHGLRARGLDVPYTSTAATPSSPHFEEVGTAEPGDLVVYYSHGDPYHVGVVDAAGNVLSATLNAGAVTTPFAAFAGAIRYWRPRRPADAEATRSPAPLRRR